MCKRAVFVGLCVPLLHMCRLMNSWSVCWDAVTTGLKCYLLGRPTLQIKPPSPELQSKLRTCLHQSPRAAQRPAHSSSSIKVCRFLLLTRSQLRKWLEWHCFCLYPIKVAARQQIHPQSSIRTCTQPVTELQDSPCSSEGQSSGLRGVWRKGLWPPHPDVWALTSNTHSVNKQLLSKHVMTTAVA